MFFCILLFVATIIHHSNGFSPRVTSLHHRLWTRTLSLRATATTRPLDWSKLVDAAFLITCPDGDSKGERLQSAKKILDSNSLTPLVSVCEFQTDEENGIRGCHSSHIKIYEKIRERPDFSSSFSALVVEDNISDNEKLDQVQLDSLSSFKNTNSWDMLHLAYITYVPGLTTTTTKSHSNIVNLKCGLGSALGTTSYIINGEGINKILAENQRLPFEVSNLPIPDLMAKLFPTTRYGLYPMPFHRSSKIKSLVNPQLDSLRGILFKPFYTQAFEKLIVSTGLSSNILFISIVIGLFGVSLASAKTSLDALVEVFTTGGYDGFIAIPLVSGLVSLISLAVLAQGVALAPKQQQEEE